MKSVTRPVENFGRNIRFAPQRYYTPGSEAAVLEILARHAGQQIRVLGSGHSWSEAIVCDQILIDVRQINSVSIDQDKMRVRVGAGCQVKRLLANLARHGLTLPSIGLIDEQTVAGATATGTHGSGKHSLSHYVTGVRVAHYDGPTGQPTVSTIDQGPGLRAARCPLGLAGVIVEMEFECRPVYNVQEHSKRHSCLNDVLAAEVDYPLQQFYLMPWSWHWFGHHRVETAAPRSRLAPLYHAYWYLGIDWGLHLIIFFLVKILRMRWAIRFFFRRVLPLAIARNWRVVDDSSRMLVMEHELFRHIEIELFVTRSQLPDALTCVADVMAVFGGQSPPGGTNDPELEGQRGIYCHHYPVCVRRILPDDTLVSMASPRKENSEEDWYAISLISYQRPDDRAGFFAFAKFLADRMEAQFSARCHWGKYNPLTRDQNQRLYPRLNEFREIVEHLDPRGVFCNRWLHQALGFSARSGGRMSGTD